MVPCVSLCPELKIDSRSLPFCRRCSYEAPLVLGHTIILNGYNLGRNYLIGNATSSPPLNSNSPPSASTLYTGLRTSPTTNVTYETNVTFVEGLLNATSAGINHYLTVESGNITAIDGYVAVLVVRRMGFTSL